LEIAIKISTKNIDRLPGKTLIAADVSGSMNFPVSAKSDLTCAEVAVLMLSIANYICEESITMTFDDNLYACNLSTQNGIIANANSIKVNAVERILLCRCAICWTRGYLLTALFCCLTMR